MSNIKSSRALNFQELQPLLTPIAILIGAVIVSFTVYFSFKGANFNFGVVSGKTTTNSDTVATDPGTDTGTVSAQTSIDDDPYLGNKEG